MKYEGYRGNLEENFGNLVPLHNMPVTGQSIPGPQNLGNPGALQPTSDHIAAAQNASAFHD